MSYLVLARKYRPRTFADLVGQEQVGRTLKNALAAGRVAHAYLFAGPRGVGKTTAARLLAMSLSCLAEEASRPCGLCENCLEIQSGQAVDVMEIDGASNRGIDNIRDLRETVKYLPAKSPRKVYIIDEVHALTADAFRALLKTLEEPPPHVLFIFATTETHKVPATILSRCQRYDFRRLRTGDIAGRLARVAELENIPAEPEALDLIARQAEGGLRDALSLMDQAIASGAGSVTAENTRRDLGLIDQALALRLAEAALAGQAAAATAAVDEAYLRGYDLKMLAVKLLEYSRALTLIKAAPPNAARLDLPEAETARLTEIAGRHSLETLHLHFDSWLRFQREMGFSRQPRWLLESQVIRLARLTPVTPLAEIWERLNRLLSGGGATGALGALGATGALRATGALGATGQIPNASAVAASAAAASARSAPAPTPAPPAGPPPGLEADRAAREALENKLAELRKAPDLLPLQKALPGEFVDFRPAPAGVNFSAEPDDPKEPADSAGPGGWEDD